MAFEEAVDDGEDGGENIRVDGIEGVEGVGLVLYERGGRGGQFPTYSASLSTSFAAFICSTESKREKRIKMRTEINKL